MYVVQPNLNASAAHALRPTAPPSCQQLLYLPNLMHTHTHFYSHVCGVSTWDHVAAPPRKRAQKATAALMNATVNRVPRSRRRQQQQQQHKPPQAAATATHMHEDHYQHSTRRRDADAEVSDSDVNVDGCA